jgi:hypothetical protein
VRAQAQAAASAFVEHINRTIALVIERGPAWFASIDIYQREIDEQVQALMEQAAKLRTKRGNFSRLEVWVERTGGNIRPPTPERPGSRVCGAQEPYAHFPYSEIPQPASGDHAEEEARLTDFFMQSFAGWDGKQKPITDDEARVLAQRNAASRSRLPEQEVELSELDEDDLVDWILGTGAFDEQPKPGPDLVVAAAEGEAEMAARLLKAERRATESVPRQEVVDQLERIGSTR